MILNNLTISHLSTKHRDKSQQQSSIGAKLIDEAITPDMKSSRAPWSPCVIVLRVSISALACAHELSEYGLNILFLKVG